MKTLRLIGAIVLATFLLAVGGTSVQSQTPLCTDREHVVSQLKKEYSEAPVALGIANNGGVIELFTSETTWTLTITSSNGVTCMIAAGEDWQTIKVVRGNDL